MLERLDPAAHDVLARAQEQAREAGEPELAPAHLLVAMSAGEPALGSGLPLGDIGSRGADARLLEAMLALPGRAAALLSAHGVDEQTLDRFAAPT